MKPAFMLEADCSNCAALCCVALAFDKSDLFGIDKANGEACPNLSGNGRCSIHERLATKGFLGCVQYSCHGAGQRVTQEVFAGRTWQDEAELRVPMVEAYAIMCRVHELLVLLAQTRKLKLEPHQLQDIAKFEQALNPSNGWTIALLEKFASDGLDGHIRAFFKTLKPYVTK